MRASAHYRPRFHALAQFTLRDLARIKDPSTFRRVYDEHVGLIQYVATRMGAKGGDADDVVQETFLKLLDHAGKIDDPAKLRAWLSTTARRCAIDQARRKKPGLMAGEADLAQVAAPSDDALAHEMDLALVRDLIDDVVAQTGGDTFRKFYVDGLTARQIAEEEGEAVSTVTTRLTRVRERFRNRFEQRLTDLRARRP